MKSFQLVFALLFIFCCIPFNNAQTIHSTFPALANQKVKFCLFDGLHSMNIDSVLVGANDNFHSIFQPIKPELVT